MALRSSAFVDTIKHLPNHPRMAQHAPQWGPRESYEASQYFIGRVTAKLQYLDAAQRRERAPLVHRFTATHDIPALLAAGLLTPNTQSPCSLPPRGSMPASLAASRVELGLASAHARAAPRSLLARGWRCVVNLLSWLQGA